ncbi:hypothetical protein CLV92_11914 [Kineococcus xinjiangensis]|uniref:Uncharacterized protein n=1 Tax=Kineococcus xinjiangensis TaxID=512762 RepID=A0A2S6ICN8_9ACTN|nr:hypothetical protein [Kineococcus xinjiangensis]PPK91933.1 hypothetical protein CLV92_11914 [Kineococcus xinjiangensis]
MRTTPPHIQTAADAAQPTQRRGTTRTGSSRHGAAFSLRPSATWPARAQHASTATFRYGLAEARSWDWLHPKLTHRAGWADHVHTLPIIEGTLIRLQAEHLPGERESNPKPVWLWMSTTDLSAEQVDQC